MEVAYGIGVKNRYAMLMEGEDADPLDMLSKAKEDPEKDGAARKSTKKSTQAGSQGHADPKSGTGKDASSSSISSASKTKGTLGSKQSGSSPSAKSGKEPLATQVNNSAPNSTSKRTGPKEVGSNRQTGKDSEGNKSKGVEARQNKPKGERIIRPSANANTQAFGSAPQNDSSAQPSGFKDQKDFEERKNRRNREDRGPPSTNFSSEFRDRGDEGFRGTGRGRGSRGAFRGRGGRGGRGAGANFDNRGKREYDRQSGSDKTGIKAVEKRDGSGAHNWGTVTDELEAQLNPVMDETQESAERSGDETAFDNNDVKDESGAPPEEDQAKEGESAEESVKEMTYEEWKQIEEAKRAAPKFNLRKPGEGEDNSQWKKTYVLKKKKNEDDEDEYEEVIVEEEVRHGRPKKVIEIDINFKDEGRDTRRGRGRGGPRGGRGGPRGGGRGGAGTDSGNAGGRRGGPFKKDSKEQAAPKVDDWNDFPSLAAA